MALRNFPKFPVFTMAICAASAILLASPLSASGPQAADKQAHEKPADVQSASQTQGRMLDPATAAKLFGRRPMVQQISLSPDGTTMVLLSGGTKEETFIHKVDIASKTIHRVTSANGNPFHFNWCEFASNQRLVCSLRFIERDQGVLLPFSRLLAMNLDGSNVKALRERKRSKQSGYSQNTGSVLDWLPGEGSSVMMTQDFVPDGNAGATRVRNDQEGLGVVMMDTDTLKRKMVEKPTKQASGFLTDGQGNIRMAMYRVNTSRRGYVSGEHLIRYRLADSKDWQPFSKYDGEDGSDFWPIAIDAKSDRVFGMAKNDGREALFAISLDGRKTSELIFAHPEVDVSSIVRFGDGGRIVGVRYATDKPKIEYFDKELARLANRLAKAIPGLPIIEFIDASQDESKILLFAGSDQDPGRYYLYDKASNNLNEMILRRPLLEGVALSSVEAFTYKSTDGVDIPAYLTLPPGKTRADAKNLPAIVMPHGGPSSRDVWGFDWLAQFFAHQGYAVLQANYRGSTGYGDSFFIDNGFRNWQTAISDINQGGKWMVSEGLADPAKLAIVGWSYGGYAALQSEVLEPGLFKAIAAIAPVVDQKMLVDEAREYTNYDLVKSFIGEGPHVVQGSPLRNIERINAPVLLFHGDEDINVDVTHSRAMYKALKKDGKPVEYFEYQGLDHQLPNSETRAEMLLKIHQFLEQKM